VQNKKIVYLINISAKYKGERQKPNIGKKQENEIKLE
jgi:hypothetical protein